MDEQTNTKPSRRRGRPVLMTRVHPELRERVFALAEQRGVDASDILRKAIAVYVAPEAPQEILFRLST